MQEQDKDEQTPYSAIKITKDGSITIPNGILSIQTETIQNLGLIKRSCNVDINQKIKNLTLTSNLTNEDSKISHTEKIEYSKEFDKGITANTELQSNKDESYIKLGVKQNLFNPDNIENTVNQDKIRKEELIENADKFSLQTKLGYSKENEGIYSKNSLIYRVDNSNFIKTEYNHSKDNREIITSLDLKKFKVDYNNTKSKAEITETTTNSLNTQIKGKKNQYNIGFDASKTETTGENPELSHRFDVNAAAKFNRTEYGEFNSGFNAELKSSVSFGNRGKLCGYNAQADLAYNWYGSENKNSTTDCLIRGNVTLSKFEDNKVFESSIFGAYRTNNCRTIIEPGVIFSSEKNNEGTQKELKTSLGFYRQVGKNFDDAVVYSNFKCGKQWNRTATEYNSHPFASLKIGTNIKATKKLALDANINVASGGHFGGEIGGRFTF